MIVGWAGLVKLNHGLVCLSLIYFVFYFLQFVRTRALYMGLW